MSEIRDRRWWAGDPYECPWGWSETHVCGYTKPPLPTTEKSWANAYVTLCGAYKLSSVKLIEIRPDNLAVVEHRAQGHFLYPTHAALYEEAIEAIKKEYADLEAKCKT